MNLQIRNLVIAGAIAASSQLLAQVPTATYIGPDGGSWNNPNNWSTGLIPDADTNVVVNLGTVVVPQGYKPELKGILITGITARVDKLPGAAWDVDDETIINGGSLVLHSTDMVKELTGTLLVGDETTPGLLTLNPTPKSKRVVVLQSSAQLSMGLGGSLASHMGLVGEGTYATLIGETVNLNGNLQIAQYYGFVPTLGQQFDIIKSTRSTTGQFTGLGEGAIAGNVGGLDLRISYVGGDGDDVVLTAVPEPMTLAGLSLGLLGLLRSRRKRLDDLK